MVLAHGTERKVNWKVARGPGRDVKWEVEHRLVVMLVLAFDVAAVEVVVVEVGQGQLREEEHAWETRVLEPQTLPARPAEPRTVLCPPPFLLLLLVVVLLLLRSLLPLLQLLQPELLVVVVGVGVEVVLGPPLLHIPLLCGAPAQL